MDMKAMMEPGAAGPTRPASGNAVEEDRTYITKDRSDDNEWIHQYVREVNLVNTTEELDNDRARSGVLCRTVFGEYPVRKKKSEDQDQGLSPACT